MTIASHYVGWIPGKPWHRRKWRRLGVKGKMKFSWKRTAFGIGVFEHCQVDDVFALDRLLGAGLPNVVSFSRVPKECEAE